MEHLPAYSSTPNTGQTNANSANNLPNGNPCNHSNSSNSSGYIHANSMALALRQQHQHQPYQQPQPQPQHQQQQPTIGLSGIYSQSGFDLLGIMSRVYHRPNQKIHLGNVDLSASFTITNPRLPDDPIVYASESFSKLTGYSYSEVLGFNCRFLQAPSGPGSVGKASDRAFTDGKVVYQIREHVNRHMECQFSLINYRKSGEPFINLITIIPLFAPGTSNVEYFVGFQVDLVEQPRAILGRCKEGNYVAGYKNLEEHAPREVDPRGVIVEDSYASEGGSASGGNGPAGMGSGSSSIIASASHLSRNLLPIPDNIAESVVDGGDFVFLLSLRARFLYVPPKASVELLGFQASEVNGKKLQDHVHPADLLSAIRELRSAKVGSVINFLCRFRKRSGGFIYLDVNGHIFEGNNSNKKCFVLSGRPVPVPNTPNPPCGPNKHDLWLKITPEGIILLTSSLNYALYGIPQPTATEDATSSVPYSPVLGTSVHDLIAVEDRPTFHQCLFLACRTQSVMECIVRGCAIGVNRDVIRMVVNLIPETGPQARHVFMRIGPHIQDDSDGGSGGFSRGGDENDRGKGSGVWPLDGVSVDSRSVIDLLKVGNESGNATSLHYEINGLKVQNKKLREELEAIS
ncbi:blue light receptor [Chytriomyces hyalinus]|nr:blue light receptor [Chytriomyces hyalinus]KAJ3250020.1 blue light receptor [Chytriomyces hyalinus]